MARLSLLLLVVFATACVPPLTFCTVAGTDDLIFSGSECPEACFVDADGDGYGAAFYLLRDGEECTRENGLTNREGDCDDADDNRFPTNPEVCDGRDNDCFPPQDPDDGEDGIDGEPDFDAEGEIETDEGSLVFSCTPPLFVDDFGEFESVDEIRFFLRGGGSLDGQTVDGRNSQVVVEGDEPLRGTIKIRALVGPETESAVFGAIAASWAPDRATGFVPFFDTGELDGEEIAPGYFDFEIDVGQEADGIEAPSFDEESTNLHQLTLAASGYMGEPKHVASLTHFDYCCPPNEVCECEAVWGDSVEPGDTPPPPDLASLDPLDLAGCRSYGAARMPTLRASAGLPTGPGGPGEEPNPHCIVGEDDRCLAIIDSWQIGCTFLSILVEGEGDGDDDDDDDDEEDDR